MKDSRAALSQLAIALATVAGALMVPVSAGAQGGPDCQAEYKAAIAEANETHSREAKACHGNGACIQKANAKKGEKIRDAGRRKYDCQRVAAQLKSQTPQMDTRNQWGSGGGNTSIFTDEKGQKWAFQTRVSQGGLTWVLQRTPPKINQMGALREVYGTYKEIQNRQPQKYIRGTMQ